MRSGQERHLLWRVRVPARVMPLKILSAPKCSLAFLPHNILLVQTRSFPFLCLACCLLKCHSFDSGKLCRTCTTAAEEHRLQCSVSLASQTAVQALRTLLMANQPTWPLERKAGRSNRVRHFRAGRKPSTEIKTRLEKDWQREKKLLYSHIHSCPRTPRCCFEESNKRGYKGDVHKHKTLL